MPEPKSFPSEKLSDNSVHEEVSESNDPSPQQRKRAAAKVSGVQKKAGPGENPP